MKILLSCLLPALLLAADQGNDVRKAKPEGYAGYFGEQLASHYFHPHFHWAAAFSEYDGTIMIEDGSLWRVSDDGFRYISDWKRNDPLCLELITPWFAEPYYTIENQSDRQHKVIKVTLANGPTLNGKFSRQIMSIDGNAKTITLTDRTRWNLNDLNACKKWAVGDYVVVAKNSYYGSVLLNIDLKEEAYATLRKWIYGECN